MSPVVGTPMVRKEDPRLLTGEARYVDDLVIPGARYLARDAADAVIVDYASLPAMVDIEDAASDRVVIHEEAGTNKSYTWTLVPDPPAVEQAFASAAHTVHERYVQQRLIPEAMTSSSTRRRRFRTSSR